MLEHYVGEPNFRKGLKKYLSDFKYKNAEGQDLWNYWKSIKMPVSSMVNTWLKQPGFPLVEVNQTGQQSEIKQSRYLLENNKKFSKGLWSIPISIGLDKEISKKLVTKKVTNIKIPKNSVGFVVNFGRKGFYRVKYDEGILLDLKMLVDEKKIPAIDRWAIQNDLFALCISGDENVRNYLDFSDAYCEEDSYLASVNVAHNLDSLYSRVFNEKFSDEIKGYAVNYFRQILRNLGWEAKKSDKHTGCITSLICNFCT